MKTKGLNTARKEAIAFRPQCNVLLVHNQQDNEENISYILTSNPVYRRQEDKFDDNTGLCKIQIQSFLHSL